MTQSNIIIVAKFKFKKKYCTCFDLCLSTLMYWPSFYMYYTHPAPVFGDTLLLDFLLTAQGHPVLGFWGDVGVHHFLFLSRSLPTVRSLGLKTNQPIIIALEANWPIIRPMWGVYCLISRIHSDPNYFEI